MSFHKSEDRKKLKDKFKKGLKEVKKSGTEVDKDARTEDVADGVVNTLGSIVWKIIKI